MISILKFTQNCILINLLITSCQISKQDLAIKDCPVKNTSSYRLYRIDGFKRFDQLNFSLCSEPMPIIVLEIKPEKNLVLDNTFNLLGLVIEPTSSYLSIIFSKLDGLEITANPTNGIKFTDFAFNFDNIFIVLEKSNFKLFYKNQPLERSSCHTNLFPKPNRTFINSINYLVLTKSTLYKNETLCPLLFLKANLKLLSIAGISSSLIEKNVFSFQSLSNQTNKMDIGSEIFQFIISVFDVELNTNLLNPLVFKRLKVLDVNGQLSSIQNDLFKSFKELKLLRYRSQNIKKLFSRRNNWLNYLNYHLNADSYNPDDLQTNHEKILFLILFQTYSNVTYYDYPDKDFCYFKDFPHKRLVLPQLKPISKSNCTCTELFLIKKSIIYIKEISINDYQLINDYNLPPHFYDDEIYDLRFSVCVKQDIGSMIEKCKFDKRLSNCNLASRK